MASSVHILSLPSVFNVLAAKNHVLLLAGSDPQADWLPQIEELTGPFHIHLHNCSRVDDICIGGQVKGVSNFGFVYSLTCWNDGAATWRCDVDYPFMRKLIRGQ